MRSIVKTGLPNLGFPLEFATTADGILYTAQIPMRADGSIETGDARTQIELTLANLKQTVEAAGGSIEDITQVLVFLTGTEHVAALNEAWAKFFEPPYPNRATMIISALVIPEIVVEFVAYAHIGT